MSKCIGKNKVKKDVWRDCEENVEEPYKYCKKCVELRVKICTCNKIFISGIPDTILITNDYYALPNPIPDYFFKQIKGNIHGIQGCRGCKYTEADILADTDKAIRMSISSCVYQKIDGVYEYMSDALDPKFEEKLISMGVTLGNPANIEINF